MQIETIVRTAKIVQGISFFTLVGVAAYAAKKQRELDIAIVKGNADINRVNDNMNRIMQTITKK